MDQLTIGVGTKGHRADQDLPGRELFAHELGAADVVDGAVGEQELREVIHPLAPQKRFQDELDRRPVSTVDQPILCAA